jgi:phytoene synthase
LPVDHYENFPVASRLLPARLRAPIEAIYAFARGADDIADEGELSDAARLRGLDRYLAALDAIEAGNAPADPPFARLAGAVRDFGLPVALLRDLIDAFKQDVVKQRYATFAELADYSRRSANPVGRLVLHVFEATGDGSRFSREQSDAICFGVDERQIGEARADRRWRELMAFECERARRLLRSGAPLGRALPGRLGLEIRATVEGAAAVLDKIDRAAGDVFRNRPVLGALDWLRILAKALARR